MKSLLFKRKSSLKSQKLLLILYRSYAADHSRNRCVTLRWLIDKSQYSKEELIYLLGLLKEKNFVFTVSQDRRMLIFLTHLGISKGRELSEHAERLNTTNYSKRVLSFISVIITGVLLPLVVYWISIGSLPLKFPDLVENDSVEFVITDTYHEKSTFLLKDGFDYSKFSQGGVSEQFVIDYTQKCLNNDSQCPLFIYLGNNEYNNIKFMLSRKYGDSDIVYIEKLIVRLKDFRNASTLTENILFKRSYISDMSQVENPNPVAEGTDNPLIVPGGLIPVTGGIVNYLPFTFEGSNSERKLPQDVPNQIIEPTIGSLFYALPQCPDEQSDCFYALEKDESLAVELILPSFESMQPGWYEFEVSALYAKNQEHESSETFIFDLYKPYEIRIWTWYESYLSNYSKINLMNLEETIDMPNSRAIPVNDESQKSKLVIRAENGPYYTDYIVDLQTGVVRAQLPNMDQIELTDLSLEKLGKLRSPDGRHVISKFSYSKKPWDRDLVIVDYDSLFQYYFNISGPSPLTSDTNSAWSPSSEEIAYIRNSIDPNPDVDVVQSNVIVYNLNEKREKIFSNQASICLGTPKWLDETHLLIPYPSSCNYLFDLENKYAHLNPRTGYDILNTVTGEKIFLVNTWNNDSKVYIMTEKELFILDNSIYNFYGNKIGELTLPGDCDLLINNNEFFYCDRGNERTVYNVFSPSTPLGKSYSHVSPNSVPFGETDTGGFISVNILEGNLFQYNSMGTLIHEWNIPGLKVFNQAKITEMLFIQE